MTRSAIVDAVGGHSAEQIIAGVVLGERLAVTMYGAIHRAHFGDQGNLRGIVIEHRLLSEATFRAEVTDGRAVARASELAHPSIVPTVTVESGGEDVVVVTRGGGRYVTVQDLITSARANRVGGGKLAPPLAASIARSVVEALAAAHEAGVVHGAVHPRSVLVDEEGTVRLGDFVVGRALTTAVAQGADSALWRGLSGYLAPELAVGEDPSPASDVFAVGAMLFTMIAGEVPPGTLRATPAVERLVHRALDTDATRRYRDARDLLENLLEAFEDDRWTFASKAEVIRAAGLSLSDTNVDEATEDLLASLGSSVVQVTPTRPSMDLRAENVAARHASTPTGTNRLEALLAGLEEKSEVTEIGGSAFKRARTMDPISEIIKADPRRQDAIGSSATRPNDRAKRVPTFDDPEDSIVPTSAGALDAIVGRSGTRDESAAMDALSGLDEPVRRVQGAAQVAEQAAVKLELAAQRAEAAAQRVSDSQPVAAITTPRPPARTPVIEPILDLDVKPPRLRSRVLGIVSILALVGGGFGFYFVYQGQKTANAKREADEIAAKAQREAEEKRLTEAQVDGGSLVVTSSPAEAGVWLRIGRTPVETMRLKADRTHDLAFVLDGHTVGELQVGEGNWSGDGDAAKAIATLALSPVKPDKKAKTPPATTLPMQPTAESAKTAAKGSGPIRIESTPPDAEAYLFVGVTGAMRFNQLTAGRDYEVVVVKDGYKPRHITIKSEEWRDGGDPDIPIDAAKKKSRIEKSVELEPVVKP